MQVTEIKVFPVAEEKLKAFVSIVLDQCFMINDIKVINGRDGLFISMPSRRKKNGKFKDVAHPLNNETRQMMEGLILNEYRRALDERDEEEDEPIMEAHESHSTEERFEYAAASAEPNPAPRPVEEPAEERGKSLEEVTEMHLKDSFWSS